MYKDKHQWDFKTIVVGDETNKAEYIQLREAFLLLVAANVI